VSAHVGVSTSRIRAPLIDARRIGLVERVDWQNPKATPTGT
jgi:hypothetical protein